MNWWRNLGAWRIIALMTSGIYMISYMIVLEQASQTTGESGAGYLVLLMQWPWIWLFFLVGYQPLTYSGMAFSGIICAVLNGVVVIAFGSVLKKVRRSAGEGGLS